MPSSRRNRPIYVLLAGLVGGLLIVSVWVYANRSGNGPAKIGANRAQPKTRSLKIKVLTKTEFEKAGDRVTALRTLAKEAPVIATGKVEKMTSAWNEDKTQIYTTVVFAAKRLFKGTMSSKRVTIKQLGGQVGDLKLLVSHMPDFTDGQESILFLSPAGDGVATDGYLVTGRERGKYDLATDPATGKRVVVNESLLGFGADENEKIALPVGEFLALLKEQSD